MPVVSAADQPYTGVPTVEPEVTTPISRYQTERATPEDMGGLAARGMSNLGASLEQGANQLARTQDFINEVTADKLANTFIDNQNKLLYGDPDKPGDTGFYGLQGQNAVDAFPNVRNQLMQMRDQLSGQLNAGARIKFDQATRRLASFTMGEMGRHFDQQFRAVAIEEGKAGIKNGLTAAAGAISRDDTAGWQAGLESALAAAAKTGAQQGLGPEAIKAQHDAIFGQAVKDRVEHLVQKDPLAAEKFLDNNSALLPGDEYNQLKRSLRAQTVEMQGRDDALRALGRPVTEHPLREGFEGPINASEATHNGVTSLAMLHTEAEQEAVAKRIATTSGMQHWAGINPKTGRPWNPALRNALQQADISVGGPIPEEQWPAAKQLIYQYESLGGHNVRNYMFDEEHTAGGYFQITNSTWRSFGGSERGIHAPSEDEDTGRFATGPVHGLGRSAPDNDFMAFGDSIAAHMIRKAGVGGQESGVVGKANVGDTAVAGWQPQNIRNLIEHTSDDKIKGKNVVLSTGAANVVGRDLSTNDVDDITGEIDTLLDKGAKSVRIVGVGNSSSYSNHNDTLASIAAGYTAKGAPVAFTGPIPNPDAQGIHSRNPSAMFRAVAQTDIPTSPSNAPPAVPVKSGTEAPPAPPDQLVGQEIKPLPKVDFPLPDPEYPGQIPDAQLPGMSDALANIMKNIPASDVVRRQQAVKEARRMLNSEYQDQQRALRLHNEQVKATVEATKNDYLNRIGNDENITTHQILTDNRLDGTAKENLVGFLERQNKQDPAAQVSKHTLMNVISGVGAPYGSQDKITNEDQILKLYNSGQLTYEDYERGLKALRDSRTVNGEKYEKLKTELYNKNKSAILGEYAGHEDRLGIEAQMAAQNGEKSASDRLYEFRYFMDSKIAEYETAGKNPEDLFRPGSPDYLGSNENLKRFTPTLKEDTKPSELNFFQRIFGSANPLQQMNESAIAAYARTSPEARAAAIKELERRGMSHAKQ